jgi:hypothetical protein
MAKVKTEIEVFECTHKGLLKIGPREISCAVLSNGKRIITQTALFDAFDRPRKGEKRIEGLPSVIGAKNLIPYITEEIKEKSKTISYYLQNGSVTSGYDAELIPLVCDLYLEADDDEALMESQQKIVKSASMLVRALAKVGIVALIDEATGYQYERESDDLQKLLKAYISEDFLKWQSRFPRSYYRELFRLYNWEYDATSCKRPQLLGKFTNDYVYKKLPEGVLEELKKKNPLNNKGHRSLKHHQYLSGEIGIPHLEKHITKLVTIMELSNNIEDFKKKFNMVFKKEEHN